MSYLLIGITAIVSFITFGRHELVNRFSFNAYAILRRKEIYRLITHGFIHADITHLLVNMFTFYFFGSYMESMFTHIGFGRWEFVGLYFGGMIFASLFDLIKYRDNVYYQSIGASGAVAAVLFSSIIFNPWGIILLFAVIPVPGIIFGVLYIIYCQYMSKHSSDNINHNAHLWGAIFGLIYPILLKPSLLFLFLNYLKNIPWFS